MDEEQVLDNLADYMNEFTSSEFHEMDYDYKIEKMEEFIEFIKENKSMIGSHAVLHIQVKNQETDESVNNNFSLVELVEHSGDKAPEALLNMFNALSEQLESGNAKQLLKKISPEDIERIVSKMDRGEELTEDEEIIISTIRNIKSDSLGAPIIIRDLFPAASMSCGMIDLLRLMARNGDNEMLDDISVKLSKEDSHITEEDINNMMNPCAQLLSAITLSLFFFLKEDVDNNIKVIFKKEGLDGIFKYINSIKFGFIEHIINFFEENNISPEIALLLMNISTLDIMLPGINGSVDIMGMDGENEINIIKKASSLIMEGFILDSIRSRMDENFSTDENVFDSMSVVLSSMLDLDTDLSIPDEEDLDKMDEDDSVKGMVNTLREYAEETKKKKTDKPNSNNSSDNSNKEEPKKEKRSIRDILLDD